MAVIVQSDSRFKHVTNCIVSDMFRKVPHQFNGWLINIRYHKTDDDLFGESMQIEFDDRKFGDDFLLLMEGKKERLYLAHGMTDIDMFKQQDKWVIRWSPSDGTYVYFFFDDEQFDQIKKWIEYDRK